MHWPRVLALGEQRREPRVVSGAQVPRDFHTMPESDQFSHDADGYLRRADRAEVEPYRRVHPGEIELALACCDALKEAVHLPAAAHEADVPSATEQREPQSVFVELMIVRDDQEPVAVAGLEQAERRSHVEQLASATWKAISGIELFALVYHHDFKADPPCKRGGGLSDVSGAEQDEPLRR
jgi:hypothetical protein